MEFPLLDCSSVSCYELDRLHCEVLPCALWFFRMERPNVKRIKRIMFLTAENFVVRVVVGVQRWGIDVFVVVVHAMRWPFVEAEKMFCHSGCCNFPWKSLGIELSLTFCLGGSVLDAGALSPQRADVLSVAGFAFY